MLIAHCIGYAAHLMQLTTPIEPAMAVSTAINTLSNLLQLISFFIRMIDYRV